jgi:hypothetical protein
VDFVRLDSMFTTAPPWYVWFDGAAGAAVVAIGGFVVKRFWHKREKPVEAQQVVQAGSITGSQVAAGSNITQTSVVHHHHSPDKPEAELVDSQPDPRKILESFKDLPPYDVSHAHEKFVGLPVLWRIAFKSVSKFYGNTWHIAGTFGSSGSAEIWFQLSSLPPVLKIARRGTPIWVRGRIKQIQFLSTIELENDPELLKIESTVTEPDQPKLPTQSKKETQVTPTPTRRRNLNVVGKKARIAWLNEAGNSLFEPEADGKYKAVIAEFRNEPGGFSIITWRNVRASIAYYDEKGSEVADVGRAMWLEESLNGRVDLASHVTRMLVVAIFADKWLTFDKGDARPLPQGIKRAKIILQDDREFSVAFILEIDLNQGTAGSLVSGK